METRLNSFVSTEAPVALVGDPVVTLYEVLQLHNSLPFEGSLLF